MDQGQCEMNTYTAQRSNAHHPGILVLVAKGPCCGITESVTCWSTDYEAKWQVPTHRNTWRYPRMKTRIIAISLIASLASAGAAHCCTAFLASYGDIVLAGNNEENMGTATELIWNINT